MWSSRDPAATEPARTFMSTSRILILGATGMLGHKLCDVLPAAPGLEIHAASRTPVAAPADGVIYHAGIDVSNGTEPLRGLLKALAPDAIVNAVGAIKQKDLGAALDATFFLNGTLPHLLPHLNPNRDGRVIHISTDCVFAGDRGAYRESDASDVSDVYGRSKVVGEIVYGPHLTLRTSIVGFERQGFLGLLSWFCSHPAGATVKGFKRAIYSGLPTVTLARTVRDLLTTQPEIRGLYHVASEPISKYDLLVQLNEALGLGICIEAEEHFSIDRSLDDSRFRRVTGSARPSWTALVSELKRDYFDFHYDAVYEPRRRARAEDPCSP
jgi:dTDP-4-dehydrorhamnose reductase